MRTLSLMAVLLLLIGCGTTVTNRMFFSRDFMDSNPGTGASALADPEEPVDPLATERGPAEEPGSVESGTVTTPISGQSGQGYQILVFSQSGTAAQDVAAQVDAAVRARLAANSPNADLGGNEAPEEKPPE